MFAFFGTAASYNFIHLNGCLILDKGRGSFRERSLCGSPHSWTPRRPLTPTICAQAQSGERVPVSLLWVQFQESPFHFILKNWYGFPQFHYAAETESSKQISSGQISHSGQQRWRENFISVFFLLATYKVPESIKKSMLSHLSFFKWTSHIAISCKDRIAWGNLNNLRQTINKVGDISEAAIPLTMDLPEALEILGPVVKLMFSTI